MNSTQKNAVADIAELSIAIVVASTILAAPVVATAWWVDNEPYQALFWMALVWGGILLIVGIVGPANTLAWLNRDNPSEENPLRRIRRSTKVLTAVCRGRQSKVFSGVLDQVHRVQTSAEGTYREITLLTKLSRRISQLPKPAFERLKALQDRLDEQAATVDKLAVAAIEQAHIGDELALQAVLDEARATVNAMNDVTGGVKTRMGILEAAK